MSADGDEIVDEISCTEYDAKDGIGMLQSEEQYLELLDENLDSSIPGNSVETNIRIEQIEYEVPLDLALKGDDMEFGVLATLSPSQAQQLGEALIEAGEIAHEQFMKDRVGVE